jgi:hypothetical protein
MLTMNTKRINTHKVVLTRSASLERQNKFTERHIGFVLILARVSSGSHYYELGKRMFSTLKLSGKVFLVQYLKACHMRVVSFVSGRPVLHSHIEGAIWVANTRGLPRILPGSLRLLIEARDPVAIRVTLTILSYYRVVNIPGQLKLSTITDAFKGVSTSLGALEVGLVWSKYFKKYVPQRPKGRDSLLLNKTAGPDYRISILGAPLDAMA